MIADSGMGFLPDGYGGRCQALRCEDRRPALGRRTTPEEKCTRSENATTVNRGNQDLTIRSLGVSLAVRALSIGVLFLLVLSNRFPL